MPDAPTAPAPRPDADRPPRHGPAPKRAVWRQAATLAGIVLPVLGLAAAAVAAWGRAVGWADLALLAAMFLLTGLGITVGYHRLFTHRSFEAGRVVRFALAVLGAMAAQGSLIRWVATHRRHHRHSDAPDDPHTPHHSGRGLLGWVRGAWHAHTGWLFAPRPADLGRYAPDIRRSRALRAASALFPLWVAAGLAIPAVLGWLLTGGWAGALTGFLWGGLVRVFLVHHVTFSVNSACHLWGRRPHPSGDESRNNVLFGVLALGEGWHNNHHAFPTSARHGLRWWQIDASYYVIRAMALCGLAWNVKLPAPSRAAG